MSETKTKRKPKPKPQAREVLAGLLEKSVETRQELARVTEIANGYSGSPEVDSLTSDPPPAEVTDATARAKELSIALSNIAQAIAKQRKIVADEDRVLAGKVLEDNRQDLLELYSEYLRGLVHVIDTMKRLDELGDKVRKDSSGMAALPVALWRGHRDISGLLNLPTTEATRRRLMQGLRVLIERHFPELGEAAAEMKTRY
jgi:hypothetical protein